MATIEERAGKYATKIGTPYNEGFLYGAYIQGATEQHKIDIDKACEWLYNDLANLSESVRRGVVRDFRKTMED